MSTKIILAFVIWLMLSGCDQSTGAVNKKGTDSAQPDVNSTAAIDTFSGYADINGIHMYYELHGAGEPLVLIHGGGSTIRTTFGNILPALAKKYKLVAVELQAHGHTSDRGRASSFEQDADDVAALLGYLKIGRAHIFGFSNGGNTAMQIGIRHPGLVNKLVVASSFYQRDGMVPGFFEGMEHATLKQMPAALQAAFLQVNNDQEALQVMFDRDKDRMFHFRNWTDADLRALKAPTLLLSADHDVVIPEHTVKMSHLIPKASLMILPGTHGSFIGEIGTAEAGSKIPEYTTGLISNFLSK